ncbi:MAG: hypothetical protein IPO98_19835 [Saprospiraceae bacterium]|nr:hypothetical protein [Saprospiraceae bacterium]
MLRRKYSVKISYPDQKNDNNSVSNQSTSGDTSENGEIIYITSPLEGKFFLTKDAAEQGVKIGDTIKKGDTVAYVEAMKVINAITSDVSGTVVEILVVKGADVEEDQKLIKLI